MQSQQQSQSLATPQPTPLTNLQRFLSNYNKFIQQNSTVNLNSKTILEDIAENILQPPKTQSEHSEDLYQLYLTGRQLPQLLDRQGREVQQMLARLKKLKEDKVYETVMFIEQLNYRLNKEYDAEVARGIDNGVYSRRQIRDSDKGDGLVGVLRSDKVEQQHGVGVRGRALGLGEGRTVGESIMVEKLQKPIR